MPVDSPYQRRSVVLLLAAVAVVGSNSLSFGPIAPDIAQDFERSVNSVLQAAAAYGLGTAFSAYFLARYIDRIGLRTTLKWAASVLAIAMMISAVSNSPEMLSIAQLLAGIAAGVALPCSYAGAAAIAPANHQSKVLGIVLAGWTVSMVVGVGMAAVVADHFHWRTVFWGLAAVSVLTTIGIVLSNLPDQQRSEIADTPIAAIKTRGLPTLLFLVVCYMVAFYGVYNFVGDYVVTALGRSVSANAWISVAYGCGFGLAATLASTLDRMAESRPDSGSHFFTTRHFPMLALAMLVVVYLVLGLVSTSYVLLIAGAFFWGLVNHLALNILVAALNAADPERRGTIMGLYSCVTYLSLSAGTLFYALFYNGTSLLLLCMVSALICLIAAIAGFFLTNRAYAAITTGN